MLHATGNLHILDRRVGAGTRFGKPHGAAPFTCAQFGDELMSPLFSFKPAVPGRDKLSQKWSLESEPL